MFIHERQRHHARRLFMQANMSYTQIAAEVGVTKRTICSWVRQGDWSTIRSALLDTAHVQVDYLYAELNTINKNIAARAQGQRFPTLQEASVRQKIISSISDLRSRVGLSENIDVFMNFIDELLERDPELAKVVTREVDNYFTRAGYKRR